MSHKVGRRASTALHLKEEKAWERSVQCDTASTNTGRMIAEKPEAIGGKKGDRRWLGVRALYNKIMGSSFSVRNPKQFKPVQMLFLSSEQVSGLLSPCIIWLGASSLDVYCITCSCGSHVPAPRHVLALSSVSWIKGTRTPSPVLGVLP